MATFVPKIMHDAQVCSDVAVWEVTSENGTVSYIERKERAGYIPLGCSKFITGETTYYIYETVNLHPKAPRPVIYKERDGFKASMKWYRKDPNYKGRYYLPTADEYDSDLDLPEDEPVSGDLVDTWDD